MSTDSIDFTGPFKLIARQGLAIELPGQPLSSLAPTPVGLDAGELGLTVDTGDLFIGLDPNYQIFGAARLAVYPYANIRVLTESASSVEFIQNIIGQTQTQFSTIIASANTNAPVGTTDLVWNTAQTNVAEIRYMLCFENVPTAVRKGTISIAMNQSAASITDDRVDVGFEFFSYTDPIAYENDTVFEFAVSTSAGVATMTYANNSSFNVKLYYSVVSFNAQF
jgi:hypothetical protein